MIICIYMSMRVFFTMIKHFIYLKTFDTEIINCNDISITTKLFNLTWDTYNN